MNRLPKNLEEFIASCDKTKEIQESVLKDILSTAKDTLFGKEYGFNQIDSVEEFRKRVGFIEWSILKPYVEKIKKGQKDILFPGEVPYFVCTSGTSGNMKIMPESKKAKEVKSLTTSLKIEAIFKKVPKVINDKFLPMVNHAIEGYTDSGTPYGSASGIALLTASEKIKSKVAFPTEILEIDYEEDIDYFIMRFALESEIGVIFANNALRVVQIVKSAQKHFDRIVDNIENGTIDYLDNIPEDIKEKLLSKLKPNPKRAEFLRKIKRENRPIVPESYWQNFGVVCCWLSGSVGRYVSQLEPYFSKDVKLFDMGYGATEGKFNIPLEPEEVSGVLTTYSLFYEFKEIGSDTVLLAHELKVGESYELIVTTYSGLYRYPMGDIIKVTGFVGTTPMIVFEQKAGDILNLCGEKTSATAFIPFVQKVIGKKLVHWNVYEDEKNFCYHFQIEYNGNELDENDVAKELDKMLMENILTYGVFRNQNMILPPVVSFMKSGWSQKLYKEKAGKNRSIAQIKLPLVVDKLDEQPR